MNTKRLESVRVIVDETLLKMNDAGERRNAFCHLYGVSQAAGLLALKRGLNAEIAETAGMLHDLYRYTTGINDLHDENGAEMIRPILRDLGLHSEEERRIVISAVYHHSDKQSVNGPYDEILKDADVLQSYLYDTSRRVFIRAKERLDPILKELGIEAEYELWMPEKLPSPPKGSREKLADIAETLAAKVVQGIPGDADFREICRPWPDENIYKVLKGQWCAAFVYHCCRKAGFLLPIRHPLGECRLAGVGAFQDWALLPENQFYHLKGEVGFVPQRGDIVIYDRLLSESQHDHIGILLSLDGKTLTVAEGNADNQNVSGIVKRDDSHVGGYIRIPDDFVYRSGAEFTWKL